MMKQTIHDVVSIDHRQSSTANSRSIDTTKSVAYVITYDIDEHSLATQDRVVLRNKSCSGLEVNDHTTCTCACVGNNQLFVFLRRETICTVA